MKNFSYEEYATARSAILKVKYLEHQISNMKGNFVTANRVKELEEKNAELVQLCGKLIEELENEWPT